MKLKVTIRNKSGEQVFKGSLMDMPIKEDYIIKKSIEIFDDDEPCIIHQSYVIKLMVDQLIPMLLKFKQNEVALSDIKEDLSFLNIPEDSVFILGG